MLFFKKIFDKSKQTPEVIDTEATRPLLTDSIANKNLSKPVSANFRINNKEQLEQTINPNSKFKAYTYESRFREVIINNIADDQAELAKDYLTKEIKAKIIQLNEQIRKADAPDNNWFKQKIEKSQAHKREKKIAGLDLLLLTINNPNQGSIDYHRKKNLGPIESIVIPNLKTEFTEIYENTTLVESDCANLVKAALAYERKFQPHKKSIAVVKNHSVSDKTAPCLVSFS